MSASAKNSQEERWFCLDCEVVSVASQSCTSRDAAGLLFILAGSFMKLLRLLVGRGSHSFYGHEATVLSGGEHALVAG